MWFVPLRRVSWTPANVIDLIADPKSVWWSATQTHTQIESRAPPKIAVNPWYLRCLKEAFPELAVPWHTDTQERPHSHYLRQWWITAGGEWIAGHNGTTCVSPERQRVWGMNECRFKQGLTEKCLQPLFSVLLISSWQTDKMSHSSGMLLCVRALLFKYRWISRCPKRRAFRRNL